MPPWTPYTPFKRPRDTPGPPLWRKGYFPLFLDLQGPYRARHLVWPGARYQSGAAAPPHFVRHISRGTYRNKVFLPWRPLATTPGINRCPGAGGGISCAEGDSGPPRYAVRPAGRAPARLAVHCCLATGGPGAATPHAPFGRPRRPLGTFPRGESTSSARRRTKPPPITDSLWNAVPPPRPPKKTNGHAFQHSHRFSLFQVSCS